jgi:hypothetical protein
MSQYRSGIINSTTALISSGVNLMLGFVPDRFSLRNLTILEVNPPNSATVAGTDWYKPMPNGSALQTTYTAGAAAVSYITTNGITPVILGADWQNTNYTITGITNANPAVVTVSTISPTNSLTLVNGMTVTISGVNGVVGLNTNRYIVSNLTISGGGPAYTFTLYDTFGNPVNTIGSGTYVSGGNLDVISYPPTGPVLDSVSGKVITPGQPAGNQYDIGWEGLTLGSAVLGANGNVLWWEAIWQTPTGW